MQTVEKITTANFTKDLKNPLPVYADKFNEAIDILEDNFNEITTDIETAVGTAATPVARTNNPIVGANAPNANIDALDAAIGFDTQLSGTPNNITTAASVYQNLDTLDAYKTVQTVRVTIGAPGLAGYDFNFVTAENQDEQPIDVGEIIPAKARVIDAFIITDAVFTGAVTLSTDCGIVSGSDGLIAAGDIQAANTIIQHVGLAFPLAITTSGQHVFVNSTPGANWSLVTAGSLSLYLTYINVRNVL